MTADAAPPGDTCPLILTLELDAASFASFDTLRRAHFPPALNQLSAHLTLFHHLPGDRATAIEADVAEVVGVDPPMLEVSGLRKLGRGVAYAISSPALDAVRGALARRWSDQLTPQDRQTFRAHVTVQNKVTPEAAAALFERLSREFSPWRATGEAMQLWRYLGGPWRAEARLAFGVARGAQQGVPVGGDATPSMNERISSESRVSAPPR